MCCELGNFKYVQFLVEKGVDTCKQALNYSASNGHLEIVKYFVENDANLDTSSALEISAGNGHLEIVKYLIEGDIDNCNTTTASDCSVINFREETKNFDFNDKNCLAKYGEKPIPDYSKLNCKIQYEKYKQLLGRILTKSVIIEKQRDDTFDILKNLHPSKKNDEKDENDKEQYEKYVQLFNRLLIKSAIVEKQKENVFKILTELKFEENCDNSKDDNFANITAALNSSASEGHLEVVRYLVKLFADIADINKKSALEYSAENGHVEVVKFLVENGADVNKSSALKCSVENGHSEIVKFLAKQYLGKNIPLPNDVITQDANDINKILFMYCQPDQHKLFNSDLVTSLISIKSLM